MIFSIFKTYLIITTVIIFSILFFTIKNNGFVGGNSILEKHKENRTAFVRYYEKEIIKLNENIRNTKDCLFKYKEDVNNRSKCNRFRSYLPPYNNIPYKEIYRKYKGGYDAIIEPKYEENIDVIVAIPFAPPLLDGRIVARRTYMNEKIIDGLKAKYIFITGLVPTKIYSYNYNWLKEEADIFNDIIVFNMINTYWNITLLMLSMHKWIINKYFNIKYFIRCNLDTVFIPYKINFLLDKNYDVMSQIARYVIWKINYPQGCFYIFSYKMVKQIYEESFRKRLHRMDDVFYGDIITHDNTVKIFDLFKSNQMESGCEFCPMLYNNTFVALHPYSPSFINILYNYSKQY